MSYLLERLALAGARFSIDRIDDALLRLLALRRRPAELAERAKRAAGIPATDAAREARIQERGRWLANRLGVPETSAHTLLDLAIAEGRRAQAPTSAPPDRDDTMDIPSRSALLLARLPPPARLATPLRWLPKTLHARLLERAMERLFEPLLVRGDLDFLAGRRLGIEVADLGLSWVITLRLPDADSCATGGREHQRKLAVCSEPADAAVRGDLTDLLLLCSRLEDADALFFHRRLIMTGDTELGLTTRNLLDRLPWESLPLGLRIGLNRAARLARDARDIHRWRSATATRTPQAPTDPAAEDNENGPTRSAVGDAVA